MPEIPVLRTLGGCGGTLVTRVLLALPDIVLLSESNPRSANLFGGALNPINQVQEWYSDLLPAGFNSHEIGFPPLFGRFISALDAVVRSKQRRLLIRDYNYADLVGVPFTTSPASNLSLDMAIAPEFQIRDAFLVRNPVDQLASLLTHGATARVLTPGRLLDAYIAMFELRPDLPLVRYESLVASPNEGFEALCRHLGIAFSSDALHDTSRARQATGNQERITDAISLMPRSKYAATLEETFVKERLYGAVMTRLGYPLSQ